VKRPACLLLALVLNGCIISGPYTGTKYEIGVSEENGVFASAKPIGWNAVSNTYKLLTEDDSESIVKD
jgi:hypothetical protein